MRVIRSLPHPDDLAELVERDYHIPAPVKGKLLGSGFNDSYLMTDAGGGRRVLRVYNRDKYWVGSESDLRFELDLLTHLAAAGCGVIRPYPRSNGDPLGSLHAAEGERHFALFTHAPGIPLHDRKPTTGQWRDFGAEIARIHQSMDEFQTAHSRYRLDESMLVELVLAGLRPFATTGQAAADLAELRKLGDELTAEIRRLWAIPGASGIIHADLHRGNVRLDDSGAFTVFDFDHCGFGLRAYDLACHYRRPDADAEEREQWTLILDGYRSVRPLSADELGSFPAMGACRRLWDLGDWLAAANRTGDAWMNERVIARLLADVRKAVAIWRER
ncbi:phosphotransferase enzyme family protein [Flindersiella endophytica]